jgi:rubredoxin
MMTKYKCQPCGYIYDSEKGDPDQNVKPGTLLEDLPDEWICPICFIDKSGFEEIPE